MKNRIIMLVLSAACLAPLTQFYAGAREFDKVPLSWKWLGNEEVLFTYDGTFADSTAFVVNARSGRKRTGVSAPEKYSDFPVKPEGAVNITYSPDSSKLAYTRCNDLYVMDIASRKETRLTHDGSDLILNGYASWVYYEEIFGRPSHYRAFWWSPDSRKIGFYRFDNSCVPLFPIYSPFASYAEGDADGVQYQSPKITRLGIGGSVSETRYPKAGQTNPQVRIGIVDVSECGKGIGHELEAGAVSDKKDVAPEIVWADVDPSEDQYFGTPFWGPDSREFFVSRMPRLQNTLDLYSVSSVDGSRNLIYHETYPDAWIDWINGMVFTDRGLYMVRNFETGWQQIYFLSYDGKEFRRLTDGTNWDVEVLRADEKKKEVWFTAKRDATVRQALYKVDSKGNVTALTDPAYDVRSVRFSPDGKYFAASYSNSVTPVRVAVFRNASGVPSHGHGTDIAGANTSARLKKGAEGKNTLEGRVVADMAGEDYDASKYALGQLVHITTEDGFTLPGMMVYPKDFSPSGKYPVHVDIYGGPDTPLVRDRWTSPSEANQWYSENGIIQITVDPRAAGHNGRAGLDMIYRQLTVWEIKDFCAWADWLKSLPYVDGDKIGVEGFSFGGTMTSMLLMQAPDKFHYGIAGGGVYDWALYDSHYTERYMDTPQNNPEGYAVSRVLDYAGRYPVDVVPAAAQDGQTAVDMPEGAVMLKLTHGTGDDNVHFQNTLLLVDALQKAGKKFEYMVYPDGMHGYRGYQGRHFVESNHDFWRRYLLGR